MLWLAKAGYIHDESLVRQEALDQATLTQRGFTLLASHLPIVDVPGLTPPDEESLHGDQPAPEIATQTNGANLLRQVLQYGRSEEHTSELQSRGHIVCRLLLEKKNTH